MTDMQARRQRMVECLREDGIADERVLAAMATVPREHFVPPEAAEAAYLDQPLSIGGGQTVSQPWIVAFMTAVLELSGSEQVLEVGAGSGYAAAVLSRCCKQVVTIERDPALAESARTHLARVGYDNVEVRTGDGTRGAPDVAPFDAISVTAMAEHSPPPALVAQLVAGGTLVCPIGRSGRGDLVRVRGDTFERLVPVGFVPLVTP